MKPEYTNQKCTTGDCQALFASSREELRWLCYTLTGDSELSERALDAALQQSLKGTSQVFREWILNWARRLIVKFCIATIRPGEAPLTQSACRLFPATFDEANLTGLRDLLSLPAETLQQKLMRLDALSRFVFVLRAIEGYTRRDTSLLLNIDDRACEWVFGSATSRLLAGKERELSGSVEVALMPAFTGFGTPGMSFDFAGAV